MKDMKRTKISRREMLKLTGGSLGAAIFLVACGNAGSSRETDPVSDGAASDAAADSPTDAPPAPEVAEVVMMYLANEISDDDIAQFNADNENINLTRIDVDNTRFFAMFASGESPDLLRTQAPDLPQYLARNIMLNLDPYFDASSVLKRDDLLQVNNYYRLNSPTDVGSGPLYGMAKDWAPDTFLWVNEAVFEKAGVDAPDWSTPPSADEVAEVARALTVQEGDQYTITGINGHTGFIERFWMVLTQMGGGSIYSDDFTKATIVGNEAAEAAIAWFHDLAVDGAMNSPINPSPAWFGQDFAEGRLGMVYTGYWYHGNALADANEAFQANLAEGRIKMYPHMTWNGRRMHPCITAAGAIVSNGTKHPDASWEVFEWFMGGAPSEARASSGWGLPALESQLALTPQDGPLSAQAWESVQADLPYSEEILSFNPYLAGGEPAVPGQVFMDNWQQLLDGDMSFDEMLEKIESETNVALQEGQDRIG